MSGKRCVLIIDSDKSAADSIYTMLAGAAGLHVVAAYGPDPAALMLEALTPDVVIVGGGARQFAAGLPATFPGCKLLLTGGVLEDPFHGVLPWPLTAAGIIGAVAHG